MLTMRAEAAGAQRQGQGLDKVFKMRQQDDKEHLTV